MDTAIMISRILATVYLSMAVGLVINNKYYKRELPKMVQNSTLLLFGSFVGIVCGYLLLSYQNEWSGDWTDLIIVIGYIAIIKGVLILAFPTHLQFYSKNLLNPKYFNLFLLPLLLILGFVFAYFGFLYG